MVRVWRNIAAAILVTIVPTIKAASQTRVRIEPISGAILPQLRAALSKPHFAPFLQGPTAGPVNYVYDELGRLIAAIDASGNTAVYSYDPVGNIVSIHRYASTDLATISFTPNQGPSSTTVTITGTGFSSIASANSVQFNGVSATVISSTPNQIVTAVPNGATTGPLTISSPAGTVTTADSFTVTNSNGKPRIDSFAPQIVAAGTTVAMAGANFDTVPANDRLIMNLTDFNPTSATAPSMAISAPSGTGSGHISLNTPNGSVTSTGDLYIAPNAFAVSSIASTGRTTSGVPATVTLAANKAGMLIIDGKKGQMISAVASGSTFGSSCLFVLFDPFNGNVPESHGPGGQASGQCTSAGGFLDSQPLAATGTYTFVVSSSTSSGHVTLTPYLFDDIKGNVTLNSSITATTTFPGQNIRYQLFGSANQHISISITSSPFSNCTLSIINPDGTALISTATCNSSTSFIDVPVLPQNGFYTIVLDPIGASTGTVVFKVNDATDVTGTIPTDGTQVTVNTTVPGQNAKLTFAGTAGQLVSAIFQDVSFSSGISMVLLDPTGAQVNGPGSIGISTVFMDSAKYCVIPGTGITYLCGSIALPTTGTYTIFMDPAGAAIGQAKIALHMVPPDNVISSSLGGPQVSVPLNVAGQNTRISFAGTQNGRVGIAFSGAAFTGSMSPIRFFLQLLQPDGTPFGGASSGAPLTFVNPSSGFVDYNDIYVFPTTGTYVLTLDPDRDATGTVNINLYDATDVNVSINADGSPNNISTTASGQNAHLNLSATAGQRISAVLNNSTYTNFPSLVLRRPDGTGLTSAGADGANLFMDVFTIIQTGNYYLFVDPSNAQTGSATVSLYTVTDLSGTIDPAGTPMTAAITTPGQNGAFTFSANSGQSVTLTTSSSSFSTSRCVISILNPNGAALGNKDCATIGATSWIPTQTGVFQAVVNPVQSATGNITFSVKVQ